MLAQNIKKFRIQLGLSQEELARKAGITYSTLIKLESGVNKNPTVKTLQQLASGLGVSLDQLLKGKSPSK